MYFKRLKKNLTSPVYYKKWKLGEKVIIDDFNTDPNIVCGNGLYYLKENQLHYSQCKEFPLFEVRIGGQKLCFGNKNRCSEMTVIREVPEKEIRKIARKIGKRIGVNYEEMLYPISINKIKPHKVTKKDVANLKRFASIWERQANTISIYTLLAQVLSEERYNSPEEIIRKVGYTNPKDFSKFSQNYCRIYEAYCITKIKWSKYSSLIKKLIPDYDGKSFPFECFISLLKRGFIPYRLYQWNSYYTGNIWKLKSGIRMKIAYTLPREKK